MNSKIDLKSYFQRIGYKGEQTTTLETLQQLHRLHTQAIPFENINSFMGIPVKLDIQSLQQKLIGERRGGYCYEQNLLFKDILETLGFSVKGLAARVLWNQPEDKITRKSHMLLLINYDGKKYIADVGFGAITLTGALLLETDKVQTTPHESFRLTKPHQEYYFLQVQINNEWKTLYRFDLEEQFLPDYEMANWYLSNNPESHFVTDFIAARPDIGRRYTLSNNVFKEHLLNGNTKSNTLTTSGQLKNVLENELKLTLPANLSIDEMFEKAQASAKRQ
ncbi:arylamine N-acetyltransferase [Kaistella flava (ex Peng et al. 2021)]|uniref:Arylamine N-acetyltransferase n=1 Tax=Kaistella flava (ex Peng et al. 2021) TaxID=2038776 RepID=A0A7M2Y3X2_9FLAO|nr:arylamine N-acetyltransferase [Kaistella flava (ex Peng et al. 2021)]QOW08871.1 arylamine N-acetyltransferase [Kaistella flava (ex Peng et al. 2021)]